jgi:hypothetical protein
MLYMIIEKFTQGDAKAVGERFKSNGRMMPEGLIYHMSWMDATGARCFQVMEASKPELLKEWMSHWDDLVDFEAVPIQTSTEFWAKSRPE